MLMMVVIWDVAPYSMVNIECAVSASETSVSIYYTARRNIPEDSHLHTCEISSSHGGEYDVQSCLLGYTAV
jgi:hypothetical protein